MFYKKAVLLKASQYSQDELETPVLESLLNSDYYEIFKGTYFEELLSTASSENVLMKLGKIKNYPLEVLTDFFNISTRNK